MSLHETLKKNIKNKRSKIFFVVGLSTLILVTFASAFAYFAVTATNNATDTTSTGVLTSRGNITLNTEVSNLYLNLNGVLMSESNIGSKYYATIDESGTPILEENAALGNGIYTLAVATADEGATGYDCSYSYDLSATLASPITDNSDEDIKVTIKGSSITGNTVTFTLKSIMEGTEVLSGKFASISSTTPQEIKTESTVENTSDTQDDFAGNSYRIVITPKSFSCSYKVETPIVNTELNNDLATINVTKGTYDLDKYCVNDDLTDTTNCEWEPVLLTQTRKLRSFGAFYAHVKDINGYVGHSEKIAYGEAPVVKTSIVNNVVTVNVEKKTFDLDKYCINKSSVSTTGCTWNNASATFNISLTVGSFNNYYVHVRDVEGYIGHSSVIEYKNVNLANKLITSGSLWQSGMPSDGYRFVGSGNATQSTTPKNFICFGTTSLTDCKANENKYLYRIIGVFLNSDGKYHVKLIKYSALNGVFKWHNSNGYTSWNYSSLKNGLNGAYFLTNTTYDYLQNNAWLSKIYNASWTSVNTQTDSNYGPSFNEIDTFTVDMIYLYEFNKTRPDTYYGYCNYYGSHGYHEDCNQRVGEWVTPTAKIGLMSASDYAMALGSTSLYNHDIGKTIKTGWIHVLNNGLISNGYQYTADWIIDLFGNDDYENWSAWLIMDGGYFGINNTVNEMSARPVFYLTNDVVYDSGEGTYASPIILEQ